MFRRLFAAQLLALFGTGLTTVALGLLALDIAGSRAGEVLGTALAIKMVAYVTIAPVVTAVASHLPRRLVLVSADVVRCGAVAVLPFIDEPWHVYALVALMQAASAVFTPTFQAVIPSVLSDEAIYTRALSLSRLAYDMEALLSPIAAGALLAVASFQSLFVGTAIGFACSAALVLSIRLPKVEHSGDARSVVHRIFAGMAIFLRRSELRALLALNLTVAAATSMILVNTPVIVGDRLDRSSVDVALALAAYGAGSMLVALLVPRVLDRVADRPVMLGGASVLPLALATTAVLLTVLDGAAAWWSILGTWAVMGAAMSAVLTPTGRLLRRASDNANRPAVFAAQFSLSHLCFLLAYPLAGWVSAGAGIATSATVLAVLGLVGAIGAWSFWPATGHTSPV